METLGKTLAVILVLAVVAVVINYFVRANIVIVKYDKDGFPIQPAPKEGDKFVKNNQIYIFTLGSEGSSSWVLQPGGPGGGEPAERVVYVDYTQYRPIFGHRIGRGIKCFAKQPGQSNCEKLIQIKEKNVWVNYELISSTNNQCCYRKV